MIIKWHDIIRFEKDRTDGKSVIFLNSFYSKYEWYKSFKKIDRCFRRWKKICKDPNLTVEIPKPSINDALESVQNSYDDGIGYTYKFDSDDISKYIYPNASRDLLINAKLVYFSKQSSKDKKFIKEKIIEIYNEDNNYLSRITLLYNYIIRVQDDLYGRFFNEIINSNTRFTFQLIWITQKTLDIQDYKRILSKVFKNISISEKELIKMFLESRIGMHRKNPRFLKAEDLEKKRKEISSQLLADIWNIHE